MTPADEALALGVLASLSKMGPNRLRWLLEAASARWSSALWSSGTAAPGSELPPGMTPEGASGSAPGPGTRALEVLRSGSFEVRGDLPHGITPEVIATWRDDARREDETRLAARLAMLGGGLLTPDLPHWPFADDPDPPQVVFYRGDPALAEVAPCVAIVGTRRCSAIGRRVAHELGRDLARAGVSVVSGLASGIDGAAHHGVLSADPPGLAVGVVGSGLDVVYPRANRDLWDRVGREGLLLTETPLGTRPDRWRFPARNRLIAALADAVVVVESHERGGSLLTADEAADRGRPVLAVPGAVTNPAAAGTNQLLVDGCPPVRSARDVLDLLHLAPPPVAVMPLPFGEAAAVEHGAHGPLARTILVEAGAGETHVDQLLAVTRATVPELLAEVQRLERLGLVHLDGSTIVPGRP